MNIEWLSDDEERVWRQWLRANTLLTIELGRQLQPYGLSLQDYGVLVNLTDRDEGRMRMSDLADAVRWDRSRLSHHVKRMEQRGLVERANCSEDRRGAYVQITDSGRRAIEQAAPTHVAGVRDLLFADAPKDDLLALDRMTARVLERLEG